MRKKKGKVADLIAVTGGKEKLMPQVVMKEGRRNEYLRKYSTGNSNRKKHH